MRWFVLNRKLTYSFKRSIQRSLKTHGLRKQQQLAG